MRFLSFVVVAILFFNGCSSKQYFEPEDTEWSIDKEIITTPSYIKMINKYGLSEFSLPDGYEFLNYTTDDIIVANNKGDVLFVDKNISFNLVDNVIAASKKGNLLAVVFSNNTTAIYDLESKQYKFKNYAKQIFANDIRIASPLFLETFILFPTLDGKVLVVDNKSFKVVRTLTIDTNNDIKNIILLKNIGSIMVTASPNKLVVIKEGKFLTQESFIQSYLIDENFIYIATLDGRIIKYDLNLQTIASKKFNFAKIQALGIDKDKNIYGVESAGYIIKLSNDFSKTTVYNFPFENDEMVYVNKSKIYFENKVLNLDN
jgi:WD40 repeat protein